MKFIIATNNAKKLKELERILKPLGIDAVSAKEAGVNLGEVEETGTTFAEKPTIQGYRLTHLTADRVCIPQDTAEKMPLTKKSTLNC